jgi:hypothetical protein
MPIIHIRPFDGLRAPQSYPIPHFFSNNYFCRYIIKMALLNAGGIIWYFDGAKRRRDRDADILSYYF